MDTNPWLRLLVALLVAIATFYLVSLIWQLSMQFADIILLFFLAWFLAFLLNPIARFLTRYRRIPRVVAGGVIYLGLLLILVAAGIWVLPTIAAQLLQLGSALPSYVERIPDLLNDAQGWLDEHAIPVDILTLYEKQDLVERAEALGTAIAQNALGLAQGVAWTILNMVIVMVLSFYIMLDGSRISQGLLRLLPEGHREEAQFFLASIDRTFGGYMRGAVILGIIYGIGTSLVMWSLGLSFILPISTFAGVMIIIPFIGPALAIIPPLIITLFTGSLVKILLVFIALLVLQQIIIHIVSPRLISHNIGMHPLLVILAVMIGAKVAGIWGVIFGVPLMGVFLSMGIFLYQRATTEKRASYAEEKADRDS